MGQVSEVCQNTSLTDTGDKDDRKNKVETKTTHKRVVEL